MIDQYDMMAVVEKHRKDEIVVACERANTAWPTISTRPDRDTSSSVMGKGSSIALGIALARPDTKVIVFDGDGSLLMNLGTLATIANKKPKKPLSHRRRKWDVRYHRRTAPPGRGNSLLYQPVHGRGLRRHFPVR